VTALVPGVAAELGARSRAEIADVDVWMRDGGYLAAVSGESAGSLGELGGLELERGLVHGALLP
jgi:hypothetical protein